MKLKVKISGIVISKTLKEYLELVDFGIASDYEITYCEQPFRVWRVDRNGTKHFAGVMEHCEVVQLANNVQHFKLGYAVTQRSFELSEYIANSKPNPDFDQDNAFIAHPTLKETIESIRIANIRLETELQNNNETF